MSIRPRPEVGQIVFSLNVGNAVSRISPPTLTEMVVTKVGRKYFSTIGKESAWMKEEYSIDEWLQKTDYTPTSVLYISREEYAEEVEIREKRAELCKYFRYGGGSLPNDVIRRMHACLPTSP